MLNFIKINMDNISMKNKKFTLVLSGGGALGIAHIGVIEDLEKENINKPSEIIGTSMGGIVGACLSIGMTSNEIYKLVEEFSKVNKWSYIRTSASTA